MASVPFSCELLEKAIGMGSSPPQFPGGDVGSSIFMRKNKRFTKRLRFFDKTFACSQDYGRMKKQTQGLLAVLGLFGSVKNTASAHPASGIVIDSQGQVFFIYTGHGVCKLDTQGVPEQVYRRSLLQSQNGERNGSCS